MIAMRRAHHLMAGCGVSDTSSRGVNAMKGVVKSCMSPLKIVDTWIREIDPSIQELNPQTCIFAEGLLSSIAVVSLVLKIEDHFGIELTDDDLEFENFTSVQRIADTIFTKYEP